MRVTKVMTERQCSVCERTLLMGERTVRFTANGGIKYVDVCALCQEIAVDHGWAREGAPVSPTIAADRQRSRFSLAGLLGTRPAGDAPIATDPILRRLSEGEMAIVEGADLFNASHFRRTVGGIAKSLGEPRVSIVPLSGVNQEIVVTIAWDISWYQYRIAPDATQPVRLAERGHELADLDGTYVEWNAQMDDGGRIVPEIAKL